MSQKQSQPQSLLHIERIAQYVSLPPSALSIPHQAVCASALSPLLLSWFPAARGVVLAYQDVELSSERPTPTPAPSRSTAKAKRKAPAEPLLLRHVDENVAPFLWATASFLIWRPERNKQLNGIITHQSKTHITLSHMNVFPVSILRDHLPANWTWQSKSAGKMKKGWDGRIADEGGWWVDGEGKRIKNGKELQHVRIRDFDGRTDGEGKKGMALIKIEGSMLSVEEEKARTAQKGKGKERVVGILAGKKKKDREVSGEAMEID